MLYLVKNLPVVEGWNDFHSGLVTYLIMLACVFILEYSTFGTCQSSGGGCFFHFYVAFYFLMFGYLFDSYPGRDSCT